MPPQEQEKTAVNIIINIILPLSGALMPGAEGVCCGQTALRRMSSASRPLLSLNSVTRSHKQHYHLSCKHIKLFQHVTFITMTRAQKISYVCQH